jgi:ectoine hydroxylase-related dioxygenase (phytanoyl-CoA dioxygenase family)
MGDGCERVLAEADAARDLRVGDKAHAGTHHLADLLDRVPGVAEVLEEERLLAVVRALVGPDAQVGGVHFRSPQPGHGGQRLHADHQPLAEAGPAQVATMILALVDFTDVNGATRLVPGSHLRPDQQRLSGNLESHPDERLLTGPAGTAFVFSGHVLHSGTQNRSSAPRPSLQVSWGRGRPGPTA